MKRQRTDLEKELIAADRAQIRKLRQQDAVMVLVVVVWIVVILSVAVYCHHAERAGWLQ